jgi:hypothetical protein
MKVMSEAYAVLGKKTTVCVLTLENGFEVVGTSSPARQGDFDIFVGRESAKQDALRKVGEFTAFHQVNETMKQRPITESQVIAAINGAYE